MFGVRLTYVFCCYWVLSKDTITWSMAVFVRCFGSSAYASALHAVLKSICCCYPFYFEWIGDWMSPKTENRTHENADNKQHSHWHSRSDRLYAVHLSCRLEDLTIRFFLYADLMRYVVPSFTLHFTNEQYINTWIYDVAISFPMPMHLGFVC